MLPHLLRRRQPYSWDYTTALDVLVKKRPREVVRDRARNRGHSGFNESKSTHFYMPDFFETDAIKMCSVMLCAAASSGWVGLLFGLGVMDEG